MSFDLFKKGLSFIIQNIIPGPWFYGLTLVVRLNRLCTLEGNIKGFSSANSGSNTYINASILAEAQLKR